MIHVALQGCAHVSSIMTLKQLVELSCLVSLSNISIITVGAERWDIYQVCCKKKKKKESKWTDSDTMEPEDWNYQLICAITIYVAHMGAGSDAGKNVFMKWMVSVSCFKAIYQYNFPLIILAQSTTIIMDVKKITLIVYLRPLLWYRDIRFITG